MGPGTAKGELSPIRAPCEAGAGNRRRQAGRRPCSRDTQQYSEAGRVEVVKLKFLIVIEKTKTGFSAYSPDLQGCVATGASRRQVEDAMRQAIEFHLQGMRAEGIEVPAPLSDSTYVEVRV